jgi:hypothetical protein
MKAYIMDPESIPMQIWRILILSCVGFISVTVPVRIAFEEETSTPFFIMDNIIDSIFIIDIILNFFIAYEAGGVLICSLKKISYHYITSWFLFDFISSIPITFILFLATDEGTSDSNTQLIKLVKIPRVFRLLRMIKMLKLINRQS